MKTMALWFLIVALAITGQLFWTGSAQAQAEVIPLPPPSQSGGMPLMEALSKRQSYRAFRADNLSLEHLSNILWAAFGVSRPDGKRTIPTSHGRNEMAVYAVVSSGVYLYDADTHQLTRVLQGDETAAYGGAPLTLLFAASVMDGPIGGSHVGSSYQNVGLYCSSEGLANVVKTSGVGHLKDKLIPPNDWQVLIVQLIGYPIGMDF
ncbi:MAG: nitroreductase family protein [Deltaproteobacteria bacterium]|jgi:hypothetical protein|nr:nitroreductase family protein [Deltaproteobacteria bacterium]